SRPAGALLAGARAAAAVAAPVRAALTRASAGLVPGAAAHAGQETAVVALRPAVVHAGVRIPALAVWIATLVPAAGGLVVLPVVIPGRVVAIVGVRVRAIGIPAVGVGRDGVARAGVGEVAGDRREPTGDRRESTGGPRELTGGPRELTGGPRELTGGPRELTGGPGKPAVRGREPGARVVVTRVIARSRVSAGVVPGAGISLVGIAGVVEAITGVAAVGVSGIAVVAGL